MLSLEFRASIKLTDGEVGCYASHLLAAQRIVGEGRPWAVVLEDDAVITPEFVETCTRAVAAAPEGWDYIQLSSVFKRAVVVVAPIGAHEFVQYTKDPSGMVGYILSNSGARKWLNPIPRIRRNDIDNRFSWIQGLSPKARC